MKYKCTVENCINNEERKCCYECDSKNCIVRCSESPEHCWRAKKVEDEEE